MGEEWGTKAEQGRLGFGIPVSTQERSIGYEKQRASEQFYSRSVIASDAKLNSSVQDHKTDSVGHVESLRQRVWRLILEVYYELTGSFPRALPDNDEKMDQLKAILQSSFGVEDRPDVWLTICGQMASLPIHSHRMSYKRLATAGHRLKTNAVIKKYKDVEIGKLHARLEEIAKEMAAEAKNEPAVSSETHDLPGDLQTLRVPAPGVVPDTNADGVF